MKKKTVLSIFAVVASLCLLIGLSFATHTAAFAADETITFDSGAAIRIDPSQGTIRAEYVFPQTFRRLLSKKKWE